NFAVGHVVEIFDVGMVGGGLREPVVAKIVFDRRVLAVVRLEQADEIRRKIIPKPGGPCVTRQVIAQRRFGAIAAGPWQITRQSIVKRWNVSQALLHRVTTPGQYYNSCTADIVVLQLTV